MRSARNGAFFQINEELRRLAGNIHHAAARGGLGSGGKAGDRKAGGGFKARLLLRQKALEGGGRGAGIFQIIHQLRRFGEDIAVHNMVEVILIRGKIRAGEFERVAIAAKERQGILQAILKVIDGHPAPYCGPHPTGHP